MIFLRRFFFKVNRTPFTDNYEHTQLTSTPKFTMAQIFNNNDEFPRYTTTRWSSSLREIYGTTIAVFTVSAFLSTSQSCLLSVSREELCAISRYASEKTSNTTRSKRARKCVDGKSFEHGILPISFSTRRSARAVHRAVEEQHQNRRIILPRATRSAVV